MLIFVIEFVFLFVFNLDFVGDFFNCVDLDFGDFILGNIIKGFLILVMCFFELVMFLLFSIKGFFFEEFGLFRFLLVLDWILMSLGFDLEVFLNNLIILLIICIFESKCSKI